MYAKSKKGFLKQVRSLGQVFLIDSNIRKNIISACQFKPRDRVLEIGSGRGELTRLIADKVARVFAVEIDRNLCKYLGDNLKEYPNIVIINKDILKFNFNRHFQKIKGKIKVVGNIPYYITTPIILSLIKYRNKIESIFIMVQKEFAQRMLANCGCRDYGSFSCFIQYYTQPQVLFSVKRTCFRPQPRVDSYFLRLGIREKPKVKTKNEDLLFKIIRASFNKRRKTLRNSLKGIIPKEKLERFFGRYRINPNIRPEDLSLEAFACLADI